MPLFPSLTKHSISTVANVAEKRPGSPSPDRKGIGSAPHNSKPPKGVDPEIWKWFLSVDTDQSGHITATELQNALTIGGWPPFEIDTVKLLMSLFDTNRNGTIDIGEFDGLWKYIKSWKDVFSHFDKNKNNTIDGDELQGALKQFGYDLSPQLQDLLKRKYDVNWNSGEAAVRGGPAAALPTRHSASSGITFDRFMRACVVVKQLKEVFDKSDKDPYGRVALNYEMFLNLVFKLP